MNSIVIGMLGLVACNNKAEVHHEMQVSHEHHDHHMHHGHQSEIQLDADVPIFIPGERTFQNELNFATSKGLYVRYNTEMKHEKALRDFYLKKLPEQGWMVNKSKTTKDKIVVKKGERYMSIRFFESEGYGDKSLAFAINLVEPLDEV